MKYNNLNVSIGNSLEFQIDDISYSGEIIKTTPDPMMPDRTVCLVRISFDPPVGAMILMPGIEMSGNCGIISQEMADEGCLAVRVPNSSIDLCSRGK